MIKQTCLLDHLFVSLKLNKYSRNRDYIHSCIILNFNKANIYNDFLKAAQIPSLISSSLSVVTGKVRLDPSWFGSSCDLPQTG